MATVHCDINCLLELLELDELKMKADQKMKSKELEDLWKEFDENGDDCGYYAEDEEETPPEKRVRRKSKDKAAQETHCTFCKNNGRPDLIFKNHTKATCDVLKKYKCPICAEKGHTRRYCPKKPIVES